MQNNVIMNGSITMSSTNTPTRKGQRISTESEISKVEAPFVGMIIYIEDQDSFVYVKSLKSDRIGNFEIKNALIDEYSPLTSTGSGSIILNWNNVL